MTDEKARLRRFFDRTSDDVKRCALAVGALYLDLIKQRKRIEKYHRDFIATINKIMGGEN